MSVSVTISAIDKASAVFANVGNSLGGLGKTVTGFALGQIAATAAMAGFSNAISAAGTAFVGYNAKMEQTSIAYKTLLGNADAAKIFIEDMKDFAAKTPFEFEDVDKAAKKFLAMGWSAKNVIPDLTTVGNAASALGLGGEGINRVVLALGQMNIKAKVSGEEIRQLNEAGIGAQKYLADAFNLTSAAFDDMSKTGISGSQAVRAVLDGMAKDPKFKDMMKEQSQTMIGLWSTIKDTSKEIFGSIGESAFNSVKDVVKAFADMSDKAVTSLRAGGVKQLMADMLPAEWAERFYQMGQAGGAFFDDLVIGAKKAWEIIGPLAGPLWDLGVIITEVLIVAIKAFLNMVYDAAKPIIDMITAIDKWIERSAPTTLAADQIIYGFNGVMMAADSAAQAVQRLTLAQALQYSKGAQVGGDYEDMASRRLKSNKDVARSFLANAAGSGSVPGGGGAGKGADKVGTATDKLGDILGSLQEKILEATGTAFDISAAKLANEVRKIQDDLREIAKLGIDVSPALAKLGEYQSLSTGVAKNKEAESLLSLQIDTKKINAEVTGDYVAAAEAQYQATRQSISKTVEERKKATGNTTALVDWEVAAVKKAEQVKAQAVIDGENKKHALRLQLLDFQRQQGILTADTYRAGYLAEVDAFIASNQQKLASVQQFSDDWKNITDAMISAEQTKHKLLGQNISTAWAEALYRIGQNTYDYAGRIEQAWGEMAGSISNHWVSVIQGTESFGDGIKGIFNDICSSILKMWVDMVVQMYIMTPMKNMLGNMFKGVIGGGSSINTMDGIVGPIPGWQAPTIGGVVVSSAGGWDVPNISGDIPAYIHKREMVLPEYLADRVRNATSGGSGNPPPVKLVVINNTGTQAKTTTEGPKWNGEEWVLSVVLNAMGTNKYGMRDAVRGAR